MRENGNENGAVGERCHTVCGQPRGHEYTADPGKQWLCTAGLDRKDFYIPGSILRTELDTTHPIAKGMPQQSIAWFENSPAFEIQGQTGDMRQETGEKTRSPVSGLSSAVPGIRVIATYPKDPKNILLSGWALGAEKIAGKAALVEFTIGKGKIILFGFRPQYRGQSLATFPLLFNAISQ